MAKMPSKPAKPAAFKPVRGSSVRIKLDEPKPYRPTRPAAPITPDKLARAPEADDVLITTPRGRAMAARMGNPNIIRTSVRERTTPAKKGK